MWGFQALQPTTTEKLDPLTCKTLNHFIYKMIKINEKLNILTNARGEAYLVSNSTLESL